jgi:hypothetical protein
MSSSMQPRTTRSRQTIETFQMARRLTAVRRRAANG